jgi:choline dehydrogenase
MAPRGFDYVVVGAGSAGAVVAARLSAGAAASVLLLEAGGWDDRPEIHAVDLPSLFALSTSDWSAELDWGYLTEAEPGLGGRRVPVQRGKVIGGCSSVNALMWVRGSRYDYDGWHALGNPGWSYLDVLPYFRRSEDYEGGASRYRGDGGPIGVREHRKPTPVAQAFVAATQALGYGGPGPDYNGAEQEGFGFHYQITRTAEGRRASTATGYLRPALNRPNLTVRTGAQATRLLTRAGRVTGLEYVQGGQLHTVEVEREVVLSAGAFESPKLLLRSGIGPAEQLRAHGIRCVADLPGVGENLQDHLFVPVAFQSRQEHPPAELVAESGLFTRGTGRAGGSAPELQFTFGSAKFLPAGAPAEQAAGPGFTFAPVLLRPVSRGSVRLREARPEVPAAVRAGYLTEDRDVDTLVHGVELALELAATRAFDDFRGARLGPAPELAGLAQLREYVRANATTLWHPVGTCRMGSGPDAVVDAQLRVHGVAGLRVADASIMPEIVSGNTNAPTVMIGEKAADLVGAASQPIRTEGQP